MGYSGASPLWTSTPDLASVQACHDDAGVLDGDTIQLSNGTVTWTGTLTMTKGIKLTAVNQATLDGNGLPTACNVIIQDGWTTGGGSDRLILWSFKPGYAHEISHIKFDGTTRTADYQYTVAGIIHLLGNVSNASTTFRMHHCILDRLRKVAVCPDTVRGVFDHNRVTLGGFGYYFAYGLGHYWGGSSDSMGHYSFYSFNSSKFGSAADAVYFEDNEVYHTTASAYAGMDSHRGYRAVYRFNKFKGVEPEAHGTDTGGGRGTVSVENYCNSYDWHDPTDAPFQAMQAIQGFRSGTGIVWGNSMLNRNQGYGAAKCINAPIDRTSFGTDFGMTFGAADGTSQWDVNDGGNPFYSGTASAGGTREVTVSPSPGWSTTGNGQWEGYIVKKTSGGGGHAIIISNDADTLFFDGTEGHGAELSFSAGDTFDINKVTEAMDQPGVSGGALQSGSDWSLMTPAGGFNNQVDIPIVEWDNQEIVGGYYLHSSPHPTSTTIFREDEHYYNFVPSGFTGATGVGKGSTIGDAPSGGGVVDGVFFWAEDEGSWRTGTPLTGYAKQGKLYRRVAGAWTVYYTPLQYPHPLVSGVEEGGSGNTIILKKKTWFKRSRKK